MAKRRANGEGNIRKRKDGRWEGRYTAGHDPETGKPIYKNVLSKTQAEVKEKLKAAISTAGQTDVLRANQYTLSKWLQFWLDNYGKMYLRPSSFTNYTGFLKNQISKNAVGNIMLQDLNARDLQMFYNLMHTSGRVQRKESEKKPGGLAAKSIRNMHFFISHALERAVQEKLISENPASGCTLPKREHSEMKTLPPDCLKDFLAEAKRSHVFELYCTDARNSLRDSAGESCLASNGAISTSAPTASTSSGR